MPPFLTYPYFIVSRNDEYPYDTCHYLLLDTRSDIWSYCSAKRTLTKIYSNETYVLPVKCGLKRVFEKELTNYLKQELKQEHIMDVKKKSRSIFFDIRKELFPEYI